MVVATILVGNFLAPVFLSQILNQFQAGTVSWQTTSGLVIAYAITQVLLSRLHEVLHAVAVVHREIDHCVDGQNGVGNDK